MTQTIPPDMGLSPETHEPAPARAETVGRVVQLADVGWCWSRLTGATRGVLTLDGAGGPIGLHVDFAMDDLQILIRVPREDKVLRRMADLDVTLSLAGRADDGLRWVVRVTGVALLFVDQPESEESGGAGPGQPARGTDVPLSHSLLLPVERLRGYQESRLAGRALAGTAVLGR